MAISAHQQHWGAISEQKKGRQVEVLMEELEAQAGDRAIGVLFTVLSLVGLCRYFSFWHTDELCFMKYTMSIPFATINLWVWIIGMGV